MWPACQLAKISMNCRLAMRAAQAQLIATAAQLLQKLLAKAELYTTS
jgi:hypothetical protein